LSVSSWIVDPNTTWRENHRDYLPDANLPDVPLCLSTLMGERCALIDKHPGSHVLVTRELTQPPDTVEA
jgi:hypothetical protein